MKVLSLFSGVGGFDMGLENAGMETVFQCEWDKHANTILHKHWPDVPKWDDVSTLTGKHILAHAPVIDVVAWGSPCQDLSVAGKRAGLEGGRSGLFHEGIRIIKELQEESNGQYPRISIWENVVGALNSNRGADFGIILDEMAEAGALAIEWSVLDAQYFGIPQRRRRVFVIAIFDPVLASRCPSPLLPVSESLPGHLAKGKQKRQSAARKTTESIGTDGAKLVEGYTPSSFANYTEGVGTLRSNGGDLGGGSETLVTEPFVKSSGVNEVDTARTLDTWRPDPSFHQGGLAIVEPVMLNYQGSKGNSVTSEDGLSFSLNAMHGHDVHVVTEQMKNNPVKEIVAYPIDTRNALRDPEKYDAQNRQGLGIGADGDPMATLTSAHVNAVAYDEYNDTTNEVHHALRAGTKQSTGVLLEAAGFKAGQGSSAGSIGYQEGVSQTLTSDMNGVEPTVLTPTMAVRRLTPLECERLMGWPDHHTRYKADGTEQADTHRYKQAGNGVASPVAQWIAKHILAI